MREDHIPPQYHSPLPSSLALPLRLHPASSLPQSRNSVSPIVNAKRLSEAVWQLLSRQRQLPQSCAVAAAQPGVAAEASFMQAISRRSDGTFTFSGGVGRFRGGYA